MGAAKMSKLISDIEHSQLKQFVQLVLDMKKSRFIQRAKTQRHDIYFVDTSDGSTKITAPDYDWEDFRSFLTIFRQIALSKQEPIYLPKIKNIMAKYANSGLRKELDELRSDIFPIIEGKYIGMKLGVELDGKEISLTSYELLDAIVNGIVFHGDQDRECETQLIRISQPWEYLVILQAEIIAPVFNACVYLMNMIRSENYLDDKDFPKK
jgi:hypothetical protein